MFEWDQYLFFLGYRNYKKIKKYFQNKNPFFEYWIEKNKAQLGKYILLLTGQNVLFHSEGNRIHLTSTTFTFPKKITLLKTESDSLKFVQIYIGLITFCYMNGTGNNPIQSLDPFRLYRKFQNKFPGWRKDWSSIRLKLNEIKKIDPSHFSKLQNIMNTAIHSVSCFELNPKISTNPYKTIQAYDKKIKESEIISDYQAAEVLEVNQKKIDEYTLGHNFEKIETAEEFEGQWRDIDGSEDMDEEAALQEVNLKFLIRSEDPVHSTQSIESSSGQVMEIQTSIENEISHFYDEWDYRKKIYKKEFCSLKESEFKLENISMVANILTQKKKTILQFQRKMSVLLNQRRIQKRLSYGCDFDLDALVNRYADIVAKVSPNENIYTNPNINSSDISLYFLLDLSLSTDSWIKGKRVLDVARKSIIIFSECLNVLGIPFGIGGFYSRTRNHCRYLKIKGFENDWNKVKYRLGSIEPVGYTRIGPALRHCRGLLKQNAERRNWIILLTDARPNDYDRYEGKYGNEDVNQAVKECRSDGIMIHTLAIGTEDRPSIPAMMRHASYQMLLHPDKLIDSLDDFLRRVISI